MKCINNLLCLSVFFSSYRHRMIITSDILITEVSFLHLVCRALTAPTPLPLFYETNGKHWIVSASVMYATERSEYMVLNKCNGQVCICPQSPHSD